MGTALFRSHLPEAIAVSVLGHLAEGNGIRQTGRLVGVPRDTVVRLVRMAGKHAQRTHDELVALLVERQHGTDRGRKALRARRMYRFSKDWRVHAAMTSLTMSSDDFGWMVRILRERREDGRWRQHR